MNPSDFAFNHIERFLSQLGIPHNQPDNPNWVHSGKCPFCGGDNFLISSGNKDSRKKGNWYCMDSNCHYSKNTKSWQNNLTGLIQKMQEKKNGIIPKLSEAQARMQKFVELVKRPTTPPEIINESRYQFSNGIYSNEQIERLNYLLESGQVVLNDRDKEEAIKHGLTFQDHKFIKSNDVEIPF